jgi:uncharacterized protein (DUF58 family)
VEERIPNQSPSFIFNKYVLFVLLAVLVVSAWAKITVVVIFLGLLMAVAGLTYAWSRLSLKSIHFERKISDDRIFPGESVELQLKVINRKILPLPWIQIEDEIPLVLSKKSQVNEKSHPGYGSLSKSTSLLWYSSATWREQLTGNKRGYYKLGPLTVTSGDIFGFYPRSITNDINDYLIVYPVIYPINEITIPPLYPIGDTKAERRILADPTRVIGIREYTPHDSLRHIHWKATARHQALQVKVFEPTTTFDVAIFLAVDTFKSEGDINADDFELGISAAASIASYIISEQRSATGLYVNTKLADSGLPARIMPGSGTKQLINILETLAKTTSIPCDSCTDFLQTEHKSLPWGTTLVVILGQPDDSLNEVIENLRLTGYKTTILRIGTNESDGIENIDYSYKVTKPGDFAGVAL